jgi:hypothetical protein
MLGLDQIYKWQWFTNVQNITTICNKYKPIYKDKHYLQQIQTYLQAQKLLKKHVYTYLHRHKVIKNVKLIKAWVQLKLFIVLGLMQ